MKLKAQEIAEKKLIDDVLNNFDFQRCQQTMEFLNWTWGFENRLVTVDMLKSRSYELLKETMTTVKTLNRSKYCTIATGGLSATSRKNKYNHILSCELNFILTSWDAEFYDEFDNSKK